jgi:hypothetical protein
MRIQAFVLSGLLGVAGIAFGQAPATKAPAKATGNAAIPRMPDGHPDLQGTYDLATLTPVERPRSATETMTPDQVKALEKRNAAERAKGDQKIQGDRTAPPKGGDGSVGAAGNVGGYNTGWLDPGSTFNMIDGQYRTSLVMDPPDGRVPPYIPEALKRLSGARARPQSDAAESNDPGLERQPGAYDDPESRPLGERCLLGFGSTSGPPMLPDYFYNNLHQIVQTPDSVMILTEMVHDVRVVRMNAQHDPPTIRKWLGDSVGHWEGDTLVVDTTNFTDKTRFRGSTDNLHVTEKFTRTGPKTVLYKFTIEDPATWARSWSGEMAWNATDGKIYEYACHEANYALGDILRGARERDRDAAKGNK